MHPQIKTSPLKYNNLFGWSLQNRSNDSTIHLSNQPFARNSTNKISHGSYFYPWICLQSAASILYKVNASIACLFLGLIPLRVPPSHPSKTTRSAEHDISLQAFLWVDNAYSARLLCLFSPSGNSQVATQRAILIRHFVLFYGHVYLTLKNPILWVLILI